MAELSTTFTQTREYKDLSLTFARNPVTNDVMTVTGDVAVKRALKLLLNVNVGETPFFPEFGTRLRHLLFEPIDPITTVLLTNEIAATIEAFEPRVVLHNVAVVAKTDELGYDVTLTFSLVNQIEPLTLTLYLSRLR